MERIERVRRGVSVMSDKYLSHRRGLYISGKYLAVFTAPGAANSSTDRE